MGVSLARPAGIAVALHWSEVRCATCGYGAIVAELPPTCPMCGDFAWEYLPWRPFSRSAEWAAAKREASRAD